MRRPSMPKQVLFSDEARAALLRGVNIMASAVKATMGPKGRNVVIDKKYGSPTITKDGVTVAKEIELKDGLENMGAQMLKEVAAKTSDVAAARHRQGGRERGGRAEEALEVHEGQEGDCPGRDDRVEQRPDDRRPD